MSSRLCLLCVLLLCVACSEDPVQSPSNASRADMSGGDMGGQGGGDMRVDGDMPPPKGDMEPAQDMALPAPDMTGWTQEQREVFAVAERKAWSLPTLQHEVQVLYTEHNRPHLYAQNRRDLGVALGFVVARDRYFFMDLARRLGQGTLSSVLGELALPNDINSRMTGIASVGAQILANLSPEDRAYFDAYAEGINAYIDQVRQRQLPPPTELGTFKFFLGKSREVDLMAPFSAKDIAAMVAVIMYQTNFDTADPRQAKTYEDLKALYGGSDPQAYTGSDLRLKGAFSDYWQGGVEPIFKVHSASGWTIDGKVTSKSLPVPSRVKPKRVKAASPPLELLERAASRLDRFEAVLGRKELDNFGSNTWAVGGSHAQGGAALVAGDGHLPLSVPALMYQVGLNTQVFGTPEGQHEAGLLIAGLPVLAVGTNGKVAWSQVNPVSDITDWYAEELKLDAQGRPLESLFQGEWKPLVKVEEAYDIAEVKALGSVGRRETWERWTTFDGRWIFEVEGITLASPSDAMPGQTVINLAGKFIVPGDVDGDGKVSAISFDYTAFDAKKYIDALVEFTRAQNVEQYQEATKGLVGNMLYSAVVDAQGGVLFTSYQAVPCRGYLERDAQGNWLPDSNPTRLLDGTRYGGFFIPTGADGKVDESQGATDPYRCVVPFEETPQALNPPRGFVLNANNQPAPITDDATLWDDPWYIGGPWSEVRADTIEQELLKATADMAASIEDMAAIQANIKSRLAERYVPHFLAALDAAKAAAAAATPTEAQRRLGALYASRAPQIDEVRQRLESWRTQGAYQAHSGVKTFYATPDALAQQNAVATMIFNAWMPRALELTFGDETLVAQFNQSRTRTRLFDRMLHGRGDNATGLASYDESTGESVYFDRLGTPALETSEEILVESLHQALDFLQGPPSSDQASAGGFGTTEMTAWLWGLRHQVRFESLLADFLGDTQFASFLNAFSITTDTLPLEDDLPKDDPRSSLVWFPRPGDNWAVDAANPGFSGTQFTHGSGPVMRMVISLKEGEVKGQNILPGGQSGLSSSPYFADQTKLWLANETVPLRYHTLEVVAGATGRDRLVPGAK